ncbi:MAG: hypothetical protein MUF22_09125, partial [Chitinispirillaceae bacterium]|nr:hypothetical protein [Chitinispirillaceae bacterium]
MIATIRDLQRGLELDGFACAADTGRRPCDSFFFDNFLAIELFLILTPFFSFVPIGSRESTSGTRANVTRASCSPPRPATRITSCPASAK